MISFRLSELAEELDGRLHGKDVRVKSVSSDSRTLHSEQLFVALVGPSFDGHDYLEAAAERGASAALVSRRTSPALPCLEVADTRLGLGALASAWRRRSAARVAGITGSNGKTTVKEMLTAILSRLGRTLATRGNYNNDIGLPLTLCRLQDEIYAVIEMGANHPGEIDYLSRITAPDVAIVNNAARAHLEGFGNLEGVARAKAEIVNGLGEEGVFIFNADDAHAPLWRDLAKGRRCLTFGVNQPADISSPADSLELRWSADGFYTEFMVRTPDDEFQVDLQLAGEHNRMNALAAIAAAWQLGADPRTMAQGLAALEPVPGRLCPCLSPDGIRVVDDSYNANPDSVRMALEVLAQAPGRKILVLGDLGELGSGARQMHHDLGEQARLAGVDLLFTCGDLSAAASIAFGAGAHHFDNRAKLAARLGRELRTEDTVLIKGSRASAMNEVVAMLCPENP